MTEALQSLLEKIRREAGDGATSEMQGAMDEVNRETSDVFGAHYDRIAAFLTQISQTDNRPRPGEAAPEFMLPNAEGALVRLRDLIRPGGLALLFVRGLWCPYCNVQMAAFRDQVEAFQTLGVRVAVVTPEIGGRAAETKETLSLPFEVLCDVDEGVALQYGCLFKIPQTESMFLRDQGVDVTQHFGNDAWFMPLASTFLINAAGEVAATFGGVDQRERAAPEAVLRRAAEMAQG